LFEAAVSPDKLKHKQLPKKLKRPSKEYKVQRALFSSADHLFFNG
jgi:hypothetical protein